MREFKGTKGDWSVGKTKHSNKEFKGGHIYVDANTHNQMIEVNFSPSSQIEALANAKLISASPDMLKALLSVIDPLTGMVSDFIANDIGKEKAYAIEQSINKALNK